MVMTRVNLPTRRQSDPAAIMSGCIPWNRGVPEGGEIAPSFPTLFRSQCLTSTRSHAGAAAVVGSSRAASNGVALTHRKSAFGRRRGPGSAYGAKPRIALKWAIGGIWLASLVLAPEAYAFRPQPVHAKRAMVVTAERNATQIGVDVLRDGGNAVDAAVAIGMALAVTEPNAGNLGGGGFMLLRMADGRSSFVDFRERAPGTASRDMYLDEDGNPTEDSLVGYRAAGVPGTVRGLALALRKYGTKSWAAMLRAGTAAGGGGLRRDLGFSRDR